mmetsp:Transcript_26985/g.93687  ORF Transcript_26985/g.93687 Transcript_26985/m.93687 type:complete len:294 (+) Transcript_26985:492-1373(+)
MSPSTRRTTSTSPTAATTASRCSTPAASSCASLEATGARTGSCRLPSVSSSSRARRQGVASRWPSQTQTTTACKYSARRATSCGTPLTMAKTSSSARGSSASPRTETFLWRTTTTQSGSLPHRRRTWEQQRRKPRRNCWSRRSQMMAKVTAWTMLVRIPIMTVRRRMTTLASISTTMTWPQRQPLRRRWAQGALRPTIHPHPVAHRALRTVECECRPSRPQRRARALVVSLQLLRCPRTRRPGPATLVPTLLQASSMPAPGTTPMAAIAARVASTSTIRYDPGHFVASWRWMQ